jgi:hypothetical protein
MVTNLPTVQTSNEALKVMLSEDDKLVAAFKEKVDYLGEFLVQDGQHEAAQFMLVLRGMLDHEVRDKQQLHFFSFLFCKTFSLYFSVLPMHYNLQ